MIFPFCFTTPSSPWTAKGKTSPSMRACPQELAGRLKKPSFRLHWLGRKDFTVKNRQYTYTRISRSLLHILLGMTKEDAAKAREAGFAPLRPGSGFPQRGCSPAHPNQKKVRHPSHNQDGRTVNAMCRVRPWPLLRQDVYAAHLRQGAEALRYQTAVRNEYTQPLCIL